MNQAVSADLCWWEGGRKKQVAGSEKQVARSKKQAVRSGEQEEAFGLWQSNAERERP